MHGRGCMTGGSAWQRGMHGRGHAWWGEECVVGSMRGGGGGVCVQEMATEACGTHPTGMHSCICIDLQTINDHTSYADNPTAYECKMIVLVDGTVHSDSYITPIVIVCKLCKLFTLWLLS